MTDPLRAPDLERRIAPELIRAWRRALAVITLTYAVVLVLFLGATAAEVITLDAWGPVAFVAWVALIPMALLTYCIMVGRSHTFRGAEAREFRRWLYIRAGLIAAAGAVVLASVGLWFWGSLAGS